VKGKRKLGDGTPCWLVSAAREGFASDGLCNGIDLFLQIFASGLWVSKVSNNGLTTIVGDECRREQEMVLTLFF